MNRNNLMILLAYALSVALSAEPAKEKVIDKKPAQSKKAEEASFTIAGIKLSIEDAINIVLEKNLTLQNAKYDVIMSDTAVLKSKKKYAPVVSAEGKYGSYINPASGLSSFTGTEGYQFDTTLQVSKLFSTGTLLYGGVKETMLDANDAAINIPIGSIIVPFKSAEPAYHKPGFFIGIQQELLKNTFGYADRAQEKLLKTQASAQRAATINLLSGLVVQALVDYWQVTIQKAAVENAKLEESSNRQVRAIVSRNVSYGLAESFDLNNYNSRVAATQAKVAGAEQQLAAAIRKLLRTVNMPPDTKIEGITNLIDTLPVIDSEAALKAAFEKRIDLRNAKIEMESSKLQQDMYENMALPSLTANFQLATQSQNNNFGTAFSDASSLNYRQWSVGVKMSYPLWDQEVKANLRNSGFAVTQARIKLENTQQEVRDDVLNRIDQVKLAHEVLMNSVIAKREGEAYYRKMLARTRTGKFNLVAVGQALENMTFSRQRELEALVNFNISLLMFDLSKNEIFERYHVDVEKILARVK